MSTIFAIKGSIDSMYRIGYGSSISGAMKPNSYYNLLDNGWSIHSSKATPIRHLYNAMFLENVLSELLLIENKRANKRIADLDIPFFPTPENCGPIRLGDDDKEDDVEVEC